MRLYVILAAASLAALTIAAPINDAQAARTQCGAASWYGAEFAGRKTASGRRFNPNEMVAAHRSLPFGTRVRVKDKRSGRSVLVRIVDRGPFTRGRGRELSRAAADQLGFRRRGVTPVCLSW
jgi:rare lipoprotein A